jgi:predicted benzoate:H+ symporter BenE
MICIDEMQGLLDELAEELPEELYMELNGGILLLPEAQVSEYAKANDLYILGEYVHDYAMGNYIVIYYGSFAKLFSHLSAAALKDELRKTLHHEFTHHLEALAGEQALEIWDEEQLEKYLRDD